MNPKVIANFAAQFGVKIALNPELIIEKNGRLYEVNPNLRPFVRQSFFHAGVYLGKAKEGKFFPSFNLLALLEREDANKVVVDAKAAWLYICGRDILTKSIVRTCGSCRKNTNALVLNELGECLGFGRIVENLTDKAAVEQIAVRNVLDLGDFLRRER